MQNLLLDSIENTFHIQVHDLGEHLLRVGIEFLAPGRTGIGKEDIHMISRLAHFGDQSVQLVHTGAISWHGDGLSAGPLVRQGVQRGDSFVAGILLAGGDVHLGTTGLQEAIIRN